MNEWEKRKDYKSEERKMMTWTFSSQFLLFSILSSSCFLMSSLLPFFPPFTLVLPSPPFSSLHPSLCLGALEVDSNECCDRSQQVISFLTLLTEDSSPRSLHLDGGMEKEGEKAFHFSSIFTLSLFLSFILLFESPHSPHLHLYCVFFIPLNHFISFLYLHPASSLFPPSLSSFIWVIIPVVFAFFFPICNHLLLCPSIFSSFPLSLSFYSCLSLLFSFLAAYRKDETLCSSPYTTLFLSIRLSPIPPSGSGQ